MIPDIGLLDGRPPGNEHLSFGSPEIAGFHIILDDVGTVNEASLSHEAGTVAQNIRLKVELSSATRGYCLESVAGMIGAVTVQRRARYDLALHAPVLVELDVGVDAADTVVSSAEFAIGEDSADGGLVEHVAANTRNEEFGTVAGQWIAWWRALARSAIIGGKHADCPRT